MELRSLEMKSLLCWYLIHSYRLRGGGFFRKFEKVWVIFSSFFLADLAQNCLFFPLRVKVSRGLFCMNTTFYIWGGEIKTESHGEIQNTTNIKRWDWLVQQNSSGHQQVRKLWNKTLDFNCQQEIINWRHNFPWI